MVFDTDGMLKADKLPLLGLFAPSHMSYVIDRDLAVEPSLTQMAQKALSLFKSHNNDKGFFLLVKKK